MRPLAVLTFALAAGAASAGDLDRFTAYQRSEYQAIKPTAAELKWREIPWLTNLSEGIRTAKAEKRPLLLWVSGDEPLDRC